MNKLLEADKELFNLINGLHNDFFDHLMLLISGNIIWLPFYLWLLYLIYKEYGKNIVWVLLATGLLLSLTDRTSVLLFKETFERLRPCHQPGMMENLHLVGGCGGKFSFISSHATNTAGVAVFVYRLLPKNRRLTFALLVFVLSVGYSRIYLGVHYPLDVAGGWIAGGAIGYLLSDIFIRIYRSPDIFK